MVNMLFQISLGSGILVACLGIHLQTAVLVIDHLRKYHPLSDHPTRWTFFKIVAGICAALLVSHTIHVYLWAASLWFLGALPGYEEPIYFTLVTYTTVGYGDIVLSPDFRVFGAMAGVCGILMIGLTTAFLVGFLSNTMDRFMR